MKELSKKNQNKPKQQNIKNPKTNQTKNMLTARGRSLNGEGEECIQEIIVLVRRTGFSWNARLDMKWVMWLQEKIFFLWRINRMYVSEFYTWYLQLFNPKLKFANECRMNNIFLNWTIPKIGIADTLLLKWVFGLVCSILPF